ncbi:MAG TPA: hypothetical protein VJ453_13075, partial [Terriglobales bacterium]|nr:hypothetical protein [Terriglobales bacterium]
RELRWSGTYYAGVHAGSTHAKTNEHPLIARRSDQSRWPECLGKCHLDEEMSPNPACRGTEYRHVVEQLELAQRKATTLAFPQVETCA